jgi:hypothetical protein
MAKISITVNHKLPKAEALKRIKKLLAQVKKEYGDKISNLKEEWQGSEGTFSFKVLNHAISGSLKVSEKKAELEGDIPWSLGLFKRKIEGTIKERAEELLKNK